MKAPENPKPFTASELATFLTRLANEAKADHQARLRQAAGHFQELAQHPPQPMTYPQKEEIKRLCQHPLLPKQDKTMTLLRYVRYDAVQAAECIRQLQSQLSSLEDFKAAA